MEEGRIEGGKGMEKARKRSVEGKGGFFFFLAVDSVKYGETRRHKYVSFPGGGRGTKK